MAKAVQARPAQGCRRGQDGAPPPRSHGSGGQGQSTPRSHGGGGQEWSHPCSHGGGGGQEWSHPCSHGGGGGLGRSLPAPAAAGGGRSPPLTPRAEGMAARGPLISPPPPVLPAGSQLHPWHNRVTICNNREMPAFTGRLLDSAPRFHFRGWKCQKIIHILAAPECKPHFRCGSKILVKMVQLIFVKLL